MLTTAHLAIGWTVFAIFLIGSFIFSWLFVLWLRSVRENESSALTNIIIALCLCVTVVSALLVPVDVFLVSSMKNANGTYQEWAKDIEIRKEYLFDIQVVYYVLFCIVLTLAFLVLPLTFFYHTTSPLAEDEEELVEETFGRKLCRALKYTSASIVLLVVLILLGIFLPFETSIVQREIGEYFEARWTAFKTEEGLFETIVFLMNSMSIVGLFLLVIYTAVGIASLPCNFIRGTSQIFNSISQVELEIKEAEDRLSHLRSNEDGMNTFEQDEVTRLEQELSTLNSRKSELVESSRGCFLFCYRIFRPFQVITGLLFLLLGLLIFMSLMLNNIDKAMHSSAQKGYILKNGTLPNPMDMALVCLQNAFPLDYILYLCMVLFFLATSISGVKRIGIRFMWLPLYKIAAHSTKPQALALMSLTLILILVASNILFFSVAPDYTTFGSQRFAVLDPNTNQTLVEHCNNVHAPEAECTMTIIATFLLAFHTKAWIFGAVYYWLTWIFLVILFVGTCISLFQCTQRGRRLVSNQSEDEDELLDNES